MMKRMLSGLLAIVMLLSLGLTFAGAEEEKVIVMLTDDQAVDMNNDYVGLLLEELTGFKVKYEYYSSDEQLALIVANGAEGIDLISMYPGMYQTLLPQNAFKDLSELLKDQPLITEKISEMGWIYVTDENGAVWGIPQVADAVWSGGIVYRTDIFEEYGYTEPNTVEEFYDLLVKIKEDTGLIPLTGYNAVEAVIASGFGLSYDLTVNRETDTVESWLRNPGMKEYLSFMNKLYNEGLIDEEWPINKSDMINSKMSTTQAVMTLGYHWSTLGWVNALVEGGDEDAYFKTIVPLEDSEGKRHTTVSNYVSYVYGIPAGASDEDAAYTLSMIASRLQDDVYWQYNDGIEGETYTKDEKGVPTPILPIFNDLFQNGSLYWIGCNKDVHPWSWMARVHKSQVQWDTFYDANSKAAYYGFEGNPLAFASFEAYTEYSAALSTLENDYFMNIIAGTETLEDTWDDFVAEWEASGGLELEAGATEWYRNNRELAEAAMASKSPFSELFGYTIE